MNNILSSASKIVFILMAVALIAGLFMRIISAEQFLVPLAAVFAFYFGKQQPPATQNKS